MRLPCRSAAGTMDDGNVVVVVQHNMGYGGQTPHCRGAMWWYDERSEK
jgi:hypothetical protein